MADHVTGKCPKCDGTITAVFNGSMIDVFGVGIQGAKPQSCPHCLALLDVNITVEKVYSMTTTINTNKFDNG